MEVERVNEQKRKILQENGENVMKRAKLELDGSKPSIEEPEVVKVETDEPKITMEEIRRLKEILRQEDAKLQLIKKIKATMITTDPKKPKIEAKIKTEVKASNGRTPVATVKITRQNGDHLNDTPKGKNLGLGRSNSPMTDAKPTVQSTAASYERNRQRKDLLKQQLNRTLKEITQAPPPPSSDVNFFPSATNSEFLVLLGLELCVNRLKRDENQDELEDAFECAECGRDFSPSWKYDGEGRRLCQKCFSQSQMKDLTQVQEKKFSDFKNFWNEKEQELKDIDYQLQKDEEAIRQQRIEVERERSRREQERIKRERERLRDKEKEDKARAAAAAVSNMSGWPLNQKALMQEMLRQEQRKQQQQQSSKAKNNAGPMANDLLQALAARASGSSGGNNRTLVQQLAESSNNSQIGDQILRQLHQLANTGIASGVSGRGAGTQGVNSTLQSIHTQILKQELLRRQEKLRKEREDAARNQLQEQMKMQRQLEEARRQQQAQQQQQQQQQNSTQNSQEALIRQIIQFQQLMGGNNRSGGSSNINQQVVNQQLANLLKNSDPATLRTLIQQNQNRGKN